MSIQTNQPVKYHNHLGENTVIGQQTNCTGYTYCGSSQWRTVMNELIGMKQFSKFRKQIQNGKAISIGKYCILCSNYITFGQTFLQSILDVYLSLILTQRGLVQSSIVKWKYDVYNRDNQSIILENMISLSLFNIERTKKTISL